MTVLFRGLPKRAKKPSSKGLRNVNALTTFFFFIFPFFNSIGMPSNHFIVRVRIVYEPKNYQKQNNPIIF